MPVIDSISSIGYLSLMRRFLLIIAALMLIISCGKDAETVPADASDFNLPAPGSLEERFSYAFGYLLSASAERDYGDISFEYVARGAMDYAEGSQAMSTTEMNQAVVEFQQQLLEARAAALAEVASANLAAANDFLAANGTRSGVFTTPSGLQYEIVESGNGESAADADDVEVDYQLTLLDGSIADSSYERGSSSRFSLSGVIPGFAEGIRLMREGDTYRFWIPPELGYGDMTAGAVGPNSLLIFDVHLIDVID